MNIGVVADTHSQNIPLQLLKDFQKVDLIVHAGDFCRVKDLDFFKEICEVKAVYGNMDESALARKLPERLVFEAGTIRIGVIHGCGSPETNLDYVRKEFCHETVDVVIFGHSHAPVQKTIDGVLYLNPGSPTDKVLTPYRSYALLSVSGRKVSVKIVKIK